MAYESKRKAMPAEASHLLAKCVLFAGLSTDERASIAARAHIRTYRAGETVFLMGAPANQMMALLSGTIRIRIPAPEGNELFLAMIYPDEIFGELAVFDENERSADAVAESACTVAIFDRDDILSLFDRNPSLWPKLVKVLVQRLRSTDQAFAEVALLQLPVRLAKAILRTYTSSGTSAKISQRELASMVGSTRETVNRCIHNWQREGIVKISGGSIVITDRRSFEHIANVGQPRKTEMSPKRAAIWATAP
jgi:CRP/FNR family cyclic AMP-dependent transcriptional regulator